MKKIGLMVASMFLVTSIGCASPLMDYSKGNAELDITYRDYKDANSSVNVSGIGSLSDQLNGKNGFEWGMTLGVGNDWAVQYRGLNAQYEKTYPIGDRAAVKINPKIQSQEFNVLRKLDNNFAAFAGVVRVTPSVKVSANANGIFDYDYASGSLTLGAENKNIGQVGIIASTKIADKSNLYGIASVGKDYRKLEAGISYEIAKDTDFNVSYRSAKYNNLKIADVNLDGYSTDAKSDVETKGWGFGVSYKF